MALYLSGVSVNVLKITVTCPMNIIGCHAETGVPTTFTAAVLECLDSRKARSSACGHLLVHRLISAKCVCGVLL